MLILISKVQSASHSLTIMGNILIGKYSPHELINVCSVRDRGVAGPVSSFLANALHSSSRQQDIISLCCNFPQKKQWRNCAHSPKDWSSGRGLGSTCLKRF